MSEVDVLRDVVLQGDAEYANRWSNDADLWANAGVYEKVAKTLDLVENDVHVDIGCGLGDLLGELYFRQPNSTIIGVDRNPYMLQAAGKSLMFSGVRTLMCLAADFGFSNGSLRRRFEYHPKFESHEPGKKGEVTLVGDDARSLKVLDRVLGGRDVSSGSFVLPGISRVGIYEHPYQVADLTEQNMRDRTNELMRDIRKAVYKYMAKKLKKDGVLVVADRFGVVNSTIDSVISDIFKLMGDDANLFDLDKESCSVLDISDVYNLSGAEYTGSHSDIPLISEETRERIDGMVIVVAKFIRNGNRVTR
jgi:SAM-dependent methyltransferase